MQAHSAFQDDLTLQSPLGKVSSLLQLLIPPNLTAVDLTLASIPSNGLLALLT